MANDNRPPDESDGAAERDIALRLRAWHEKRHPLAGAVERAIGYVERREAQLNGLTKSKSSRGSMSRFWPLAAAAVLLAVVWQQRADRGVSSLAQEWQPSPVIGGSTDGANRRVVRFAVALPSEFPKDVRLVGDFNGWGAPGLVLQRNPVTGRWEGRLELAPGLHHYTYLVDGDRWVVDPGAPTDGDELLGATNAIVVPESR